MGITRDPNYQYESGAQPLPLDLQGYLGYGDPLQHQEVKENAAKMDAEWPEKEREIIKQAVINAFRAVLLSPMKNLKWNAVHYQDISSIPYSTTNPNEYWDTLEKKRQDWNEARGRDPLAHLSHYKEMQEYIQYYAAMHSDLKPDEAYKQAINELRIMQTEIEDKLINEGKVKDWDITEPKVFREMKKRIKAILNPTIKPEQDAHEDGAQQYQLAKSSMAEQTGEPKIDQAIQDFLSEAYYMPDDVVGTWPIPDEAEQLSVRELQDPARAEGMCCALMRRFVAFCNERGIPAWEDEEYDQEHGTQLWSPTNWGYGDRPSKGRYDTHSAAMVRGDKGDYMVDWTAAQYGYQEFPMVQKITVDDPPQWQRSFSSAQTDIYGNEDPDLYGGFIGNHLKSIALVGQHADELADAALRDIQEYDGAGWHFRKTVLGMDIKGVGPKVASLAWLFLAPMTSQLATIDTHMMAVLGHDYDKEMNNRDYFKFERELQAGRDAAGYAHVPLGQFQWGLWDNTRTGAGSHQDHSALRVLNPQSYSNVEWGPPVAHARGAQYQPPEWWENTLQARSQASDDFNQTVAPGYSRDAIPYQDEEVPVSAVISTFLGAEVDENNSLFIPINESIRHRLSAWLGGADVEGKILVLQAKSAIPPSLRNHNISGALCSLVAPGEPPATRNTHELATGDNIIISRRINPLQSWDFQGAAEGEDQSFGHESGTKGIYNLSPRLEPKLNPYDALLRLESPEARTAAIALKTMLARQGIESTIYLGIRYKNGQVPTHNFATRFRC